MRLITINKDNIVISVRTNATTIYEGELESDAGQIGQLMLEDGTFVDVPSELSKQEPTIEEQILVETQYQTILLEMVTMF